MQQELTQGLAKGCSPWFSGAQNPSTIRHQTRGGKPAHKMIQLRGFATPVDPFKDDETPLHRIRSASAFKTTVIELSAISSAATGGERSNPWPGSSTPAAIGRAMRL